MELNIKTLKIAGRSLVREVNALLLATALAEVEREAVDKIKAEILDYIDAKDEDGKRITEPKRDWLVHSCFTPSETVARELSGKEASDYYLGLCDKQIRQSREAWQDLPEGYCPALVAEYLKTQAEWLLLESAEKFFPGITNDRLLCRPNGLQKRQEYIDLLIGLVVKDPGYRPVSIKAA